MRKRKLILLNLRAIKLKLMTYIPLKFLLSIYLKRPEYFKLDFNTEVALGNFNQPRFFRQV